MKTDHVGSIAPVPQTGDATGGPAKPIEKDMDHPYSGYTSNETVPQDIFHEEKPTHDPFAEGGSLAKRFV